MPVNAIVGITLILAFLGYDVYLWLDGVKGNTWSEIARAFAHLSPFLPWVWGFLGGHFFHPFDDARAVFGPLNSMVTAVWLTFVLVIVGIWCRQMGHPIPTWLPLVPGFVAGWMFWPV